MGQAAEQAVEPEKRGAGHPLVYDREVLVEVICEDLAKGVPLEDICRRDGMPSARSVHAWKRAEPDIAAPIAYAREAGADAIAQRMRLTARGKGPDQGGDSTGDVQRDALIVNTDLKLLAKWFPASYGDRVALTNREGTGDATLRIEANVLADELTGLLTASYVDVTPGPAPEALPAPGDEPGSATR